MDISLLSPDSPSWNKALSGLTHDVYHFPGYAELCGVAEQGEARAFVAEEGGSMLFAPIVLRSVPSALRGPDERRDATAPYGYGAPLVAFDERQDDEGWRVSFLSRAIEAMVKRLRQEHAVSAFFRLHPLLPIDRTVLSRFGTLVQSGETVAIDLSLTDDELWRQMRGNHRRDISRSTARGETAEVDPGWSSLPAFIEAYRDTMARVGASAYYQFPEEYFHRLHDALGEHVHLWVVRDGPDVMAGALLTECRGIVQYHLGAASSRFLPRNPLKLLFHRATDWYKRRGNRWFHLGGGVSGADSLMHFKTGFSPNTFSFHTWRLVLDATAYDELVSRAGAAPIGSSFFPAYREPTHA